MPQEQLNQVSRLTKFWNSSIFKLLHQQPNTKHYANKKKITYCTKKNKLNLTKVFVIQVLWNMALSRANRHVLGSWLIKTFCSQHSIPPRCSVGSRLCYLLTMPLSSEVNSCFTNSHLYSMARRFNIYASTLPECQ
jgi:hypothetical protein